MEICVFGSANEGISNTYKEKSFSLCKSLGKMGHNLVFGAGGEGLMGAAAKGFKAGGGKVHGVIPKFFEENGFEGVFYSADKLTRTSDMAERKKTMEDCAEAFVILPGGIGTYEEFFEVLTLKQLGRHRKAIVIFNIDGYFDKLKELLDFAVLQGFVNAECKKLVVFCKKEEEVINYIDGYSEEKVEWNSLKKYQKKK